MKILIDVGHPAHVHLFRNAAFEFEKQGHRVFWTAREKDVTLYLLKHYGVKFDVASKARAGLVGLFRELVEHDYGVYKIAKREKFDLLLGCSVSIAHVSKFIKGRSIVFNDDDAKCVKIFASISYPFADTIVTPNCLKNDNFGRKHIKYESYHSLAYLHPNRFSPNPDVLNEIGCSENEVYFLLRFVNLEAAHDIGHKGIEYNFKKKLIKRLSKYGKVFISSEGIIEEEFVKYAIRVLPEKIHDVLYYATLYIGDSQTMTAEAAVLGTPAIRCNSFVGKISYLEELEHKYGLTYGFLPSEKDKMLDKISELLSMKNLSIEWHKRRRQMLSEKLDLTSWLVDFILNYT